jgi:pantoate kinase
MISYWVASHITGFFTIHDEHPDSLFRGSRGAGFSISRGTTTRVEFSDDKKNHFYFNDDEVSSEIANVTNNVLNQFLTLMKPINANVDGITIYHNFEVPLSCGFGASASGALGCSFALNDLLDINLEEKTLYGIAHIAEIDEGGGLGDILSLYQGGWEFRSKEGAPFIGKAENIVQNSYKIATATFGEIATKSIIKNKEWKEKINIVGNHFVDCIINEPTIINFAKMSKEFSLGTLLVTPEIIDIYEKNTKENVLISQIMLGNGVFILYDKPSHLQEIDDLKEEEICFKTVKKL